MMHAAPATDLPATAGPAGVSIIIPAYNYARYLPGAIDSALAQTHPHKEVIVVDDGSTDDTPEVIAHYGERVRGIRQANAGLSAARNTGIQAAQYPYVAFLDADDLLGPAFLAELMESFQKLPEDYGLVACDCLKFRGDGEIIPQKKLKPETAREITTAQLVLRNQFVADAVVARREVLERAGLFDVSLRSTEDRDLWIRVSRLCRLHFLPEALVKVRIHGGSMSTHGARMLESISHVLAKARAEDDGRVPAACWRMARSFMHYQIAWTHHDAGNRAGAVRHLLKSLLAWPFFGDPHALNENVCFRIRSLRQFLLSHREAKPGADAPASPRASGRK
jgi:glycosyltransferase involved in cell wall biosynthesis